MYHIRKLACGSTTAPKEQIYISPAASFGRVMTLKFAPRLKRAFIRLPVLYPDANGIGGQGRRPRQAPVLMPQMRGRTLYGSLH